LDGWRPQHQTPFSVYPSSLAERHIEPFGTYIRPESLKTILTPLLKSYFTTTDFVEWSHVLSEQPRLRHLRPEVVLRVIDEISSIVGFKRHHSVPEKMVLTKRR
jgi:hypothetical protein